MNEDFAHKTCHLCRAVVDDIETHRDFHFMFGQWPKCNEPYPGPAEEPFEHIQFKCELRDLHQGQHFVDLHTAESVPGVPGVVRMTGETWWPEIPSV